jgi:hypothetical protein
VKPATVILLALLAVGVYLLYKSLSNLGSSLVGLPAATGAAIGTSVSSLVTSAYNTLSSEVSALKTSLGSPVTALSSVGTTVTNGATSAWDYLTGDTPDDDPYPETQDATDFFNSVGLSDEDILGPAASPVPPLLSVQGDGQLPDSDEEDLAGQLFDTLGD